ncbi:nuclear transport factor 2 family protein [Pseudoduganella eburnea]|uniref:Nuclear transport factor 2 family protein n=1 Tax=Massilia eburnea TaxID=1776165 RepID=A0A6L6QFX2_9BURK|nr:nuclear transport factor 2 family protein [Massilia eburnea]MTW11155.1 nuclear transport factor 2 family protein [Massilia eburnea]
MTTNLDKLLGWYANLTPESVQRVREFYAPDARFRDPFNDVCGAEAIEQIFDHMFEVTENPRFIIKDRMSQDDQGFATWLFDFDLRGKHYTVEGSSHIWFGPDGLVTVHRDYWDAAEELFEKLPLIGKLVHFLRGKFSASSQGKPRPMD